MTRFRNWQSTCKRVLHILQPRRYMGCLKIWQLSKPQHYYIILACAIILAAPSMLVLVLVQLNVMTVVEVSLE